MIVMKRTISVILATIMMLSSMLVSAGSSFAASDTSRPGRVTGVKVSATGNKITVKWKKVKNAKKYQVYEKKDSGKWRKVKTIKAKSRKKFSYSRTYVCNVKYSYKVRGLNGKKKGKYSSVRSKMIKCVDPDLPEEPVQPTEGDTVEFNYGDEKFIVDSKEYHETDLEIYFYGRTEDGLCVDYWESLETGTVKFRIGPEATDGNGKPDGSCFPVTNDIQIHEKVDDRKVIFDKTKEGYTCSITFNGEEPVKDIGSVNGSAYCVHRPPKTYANEQVTETFYGTAGKFTTGTIPRYNAETITEASFNTGIDFNPGMSLNGEGSNIDPFSETNTGGAEVILENNKTFRNNNLGSNNVNSDQFLETWARVYDGDNRVMETYIKTKPASSGHDNYNY